MERPERGACALGRSPLLEDWQPRSFRLSELIQAFYGTLEGPPPILHINESKVLFLMKI